VHVRMLVRVEALPSTASFAQCSVGRAPPTSKVLESRARRDPCRLFLASGVRRRSLTRLCRRRHGEQTGQRERDRGRESEREREEEGESTLARV